MNKTLIEIFAKEEIGKRIKSVEPKIIDIIKEMIVEKMRAFLLSETRNEIFKYYDEAKFLMKLYADIKNEGLVNISPDDLCKFGLFETLYKMVMNQ